MKSWIFFPPLRNMTGGSRVLLLLAQELAAQNKLKGLLYWDSPPVFPDWAGLPWVRAVDAAMLPDDLFIVPEGWPNALAFGFRAQCRTVIYCQNWAYLFHGLEENVRWQNLPVEFWSVSHPVAWYLERILGKKTPILRPPLDTHVFFPPKTKVNGPMRIAFMPRKNKALAVQIRRIFLERNPREQIDWVAIDGLKQADVAEALRASHIFLATGFPEGFGLPPLEALACGCLCVGFTGFGGWDYMRQIASHGYAPHGYSPREVPWGGNGWWSADGDVLDAALNLEQAIHTLRSGQHEEILGNAAQTAAGYALSHWNDEVKKLWTAAGY